MIAEKIKFAMSWIQPVLQLLLIPRQNVFLPSRLVLNSKTVSKSNKTDLNIILQYLVMIG